MKTSPFLKAIDFTEMDSRFSNEDAIRYRDCCYSSIPYDEMKPFLNRLPSREVDLIELYYNERKNQKDIAKIFGVTQGAISSRLARARSRLEFLRNLPKITDFEIDRDLSKYFDSLEIEIIKHMIMTTCQSKTADLINQKLELQGDKRMTQVKVRHRFEKCVAFLERERKVTPQLARYYHLLVYIKKNLYKLHEVLLPHFNRGHFSVFSMSM